MPKPRRRKPSRYRDLTRINERIRVSRVRVIVSGSNEQLGVMPIEQALAEAKKRGLDLVEVAAQADPPVCRIVDYGKYKYEQSKLKKDRPKKSSGKLKEIKFRVRIDPHDYEIKLAHAEDFLGAGNKLRLQLQFRGREMAHTEIGMELMEKIKQDLMGMAHVDMDPKMSGRQITMMMSPLAVHMQKRKFKVKELPPFREEDEHDDEEEEEEEIEAHGDRPADEAKAQRHA